MSGPALGLVVALSAAITAGLIVALLPMLRRHVLAHPNSRSSHRQATPQGGGIAVITAAILVGACAMVINGGAPLWLLFAATVFIAGVGAWDDLHSIEVAPRLALQAIAATLMLASLPAELRIIPAMPWWIERALLLLACLWFVNLTNFMDGIDWMTVAEFVPMALGVALIGLLGGLPAHGVIVALALCGGLLGFAPFNRPVARIFLGDVGSLPIGLLFAWLLVLLAGSGHLAAAVVLPLYYLADATITLLRRVKDREPFWKAHRTHFYQRATDHGWTVQQIVARVFLVNIGLAALAAWSVVRPDAFAAMVALAGGAVLVGWLLRSFTRGPA
jgi:UDP-N-acetylmuramyl pentapeptide phosphotransferase/UDP-N-acetylglucosamine-1-phosphate transferase